MDIIKNNKQAEEISKKINSFDRMIRAVDQELLLAEERLKSIKADSAEYAERLAREQLESFVEVLKLRISKLEVEKSLVREDTEEQRSYRTELKKDFPVQLREILSKNSEFRFHGTGIVETYSILSSGRISSSIERGLGSMSHDARGQISVTDRDSIEVTINNYIGINEKFLPLGCVFVLLPKNDRESSSTSSNLMESVDLIENDRVTPRFVKVLCSEETLGEVKVWLEEFGYDSNLASEYFDFLDEIKLGAKSRLSFSHRE